MSVILHLVLVLVVLLLVLVLAGGAAVQHLGESLVLVHALHLRLLQYSKR